MASSGTQVERRRRRRRPISAPRKSGLFTSFYNQMGSTPEWKPLDGVVAVNRDNLPVSDSLPIMPNIGRFLDKAAKAKFERAGWKFLPATSAGPSDIARQVVVGKDGAVRIVGPTLDIQFSKDLSEDQIADLLGPMGLEISESYDFAKNLFSVRSSDVLDSVRALNSMPEVEFAEPSLIEAFGKRS